MQWRLPENAPMDTNKYEQVKSSTKFAVLDYIAANAPCDYLDVAEAFEMPRKYAAEYLSTYRQHGLVQGTDSTGQRTEWRLTAKGRDRLEWFRSETLPA